MARSTGLPSPTRASAQQQLATKLGEALQTNQEKEGRHYRVPLVLLRGVIETGRGLLAFGTRGCLPMTRLRRALRACDGLEHLVVELAPASLCLYYRAAHTRGSLTLYLQPISESKPPYLVVPLAKDRVPPVTSQTRRHRPTALSFLIARLERAGYTAEVQPCHIDSWFGEVRDLFGEVVGDLAFRGPIDEPNEYARGLSYTSRLFDLQRFPDRVLAIVRECEDV